MKTARMVFVMGCALLALGAAGCKPFMETNGMKTIKKDVETFMVRQDAEGRTLEPEFRRWIEHERSKKGQVGKQVTEFMQDQDAEGRTMGQQWKSFIDNM